jgi:hypothetical protein
MNNLTFIHGDTEELELVITDKSDVVQDITGFTFWFTIKKDNANPDDAAIMQKTIGNGIEIIDAEVGKILVTVNPSDRALVSLGRVYNWDLQLKDAAGRIKTPRKGTVEFTSDSTHATS